MDETKEGESFVGLFVNKVISRLFDDALARKTVESATRRQAIGPTLTNLFLVGLVCVQMAGLAYILFCM
jgi:hypothetical protein